MTAYAKILEVDGVETIVEEVDFAEPKVPTDFKHINGRPVYRPIVLTDVTVDPLVEKRIGPVDTILPTRVTRVFSLQALTAREAFNAREREAIRRRRQALPELEREIDAIWRTVDAILVRLVELEVPADPTTIVQLPVHLKNLRSRVIGTRDGETLETDPADVP